MRKGWLGLGLLLSATSLQAADCPSLAPLPGWTAAAAELKDFDQVEMRAGEAGVDGYAKVAGRVCRQTYRPVAAVTPDDAQVQAAYRTRLDQLGAETLYAADGQVTGRLNSAEGERWMVVYNQPGEVSVVVVDRQLPRRILTAASGADYRLLGHMPDYVAAAPQIDDNGKIDFHVEDSAGDIDVPVQGRAIHIQYTPKPGAAGNSDVDVAYNYRERLRELGAQFLSTKDNARTVARIEEQGRAIWFAVYNQPGEISVFVLEEKPVQAKPEAPPPAAALKDRLDQDGRVALYINFAFNKATLLPDAKPVLAQVTALLKADATLRLAVEGHTDAVGTRDYNRKLSAQRAAAVVQALVLGGIAADRLSSAGLGSAQPLAPNDSADGRARNRRVELVRQ